MAKKVCSKCHIEMPIGSFGKRNDSKDGRQSYCKQCRTTRDAEKQSTPVIKAYKAAHYAANTDSYKSRAKHNREKDPVAHAEKKKAYREENPEKVAEGKKRCVEANPEKYKAINKRHYDRNKEIYIARTNARYNGEQREEIIAKQREYVERNYEKVKLSRIAGHLRKKSRAGKDLFRKLQKTGINVQVFNADSIPDDYTEGLIYICGNSSNSLHKVGSTFGRGVQLRIAEHNGSSVYREKGEIKKRDYYGCSDGCTADWKASHVYLLPGVNSAELQRIENKIIHVALTERGWFHLGKKGECELFEAKISEIHNLIDKLLSHLKNS
jgi:hypothetical protein